MAQWTNDSTWIEDILDDYATEAVKHAVEVMFVDNIPVEDFGVHELDGVYAARSYLKGVVFGYGTPKHCSTTPPA
jgi:hypothetical protein